MSALVIRHVAFEDLGAFERVLTKKDYDICYFDIGTGVFSSIQPTDPDLVVVLGGPIGVYEEETYPFLIDEIAFLQARLTADKPTIGICLGAQLIAKALRARVYPGPAKEIGFAPLSLTAEGLASCVQVFAGHDVLHWHGDIFDLPAGAVRLASTAACPNQAFSYGRNTIGFQFHPEFDGRGFERWLIGHTLELAHNKIDVRALRTTAQLQAGAMGARARSCLELWLDRR